MEKKEKSWKAAKELFNAVNKILNEKEELSGVIVIAFYDGGFGRSIQGKIDATVAVAALELCKKYTLEELENRLKNDVEIEIGLAEEEGSA